MQQRTWTHMHKDHSKLQRKPTQLENYKDLNRHPSKEDIQMAKKQHKNMLNNISH